MQGFRKPKPSENPMLRAIPTKLKGSVFLLQHASNHWDCISLEDMSHYHRWLFKSFQVMKQVAIEAIQSTKHKATTFSRVEDKFV